MWDSNYKFVAHLNESANPYHDSTSNAGTSTTGTYPTSSAGLVGKGQTFVASNSQYIQFPNNVSSGASYTVSGWGKFNATGTGKILYDNRNFSAGGDKGAAIAVAGTSGFAISYINDSGPMNGATDLTGGWHYFVGGSDGTSKVWLFVDGIKIGTSTSGAGNNGFASGTAAIGAYLVSPQAFMDGIVDEVRASNTLRSDDWVKTEYNNQSAPNGFYTLGAETTNGGYTVTATAKGPNQINLKWGAVSNPGYGYIVEIQSSGDSRYSSFTELQPIPTATGYTCNPALSYNGVTGCSISDAGEAYIYNPTVKGVPYWVTEPQYIDPQDGTAAQFIAWGLKNNTAYSFRVRTYTGNTSPKYGAYSATATATTINYSTKYVTTTGNDSTGTGSIGSPWRTVGWGSGHMSCGDVLLVAAGTYTGETLNGSQACTNTSKAVLMAVPGDTVIIQTTTSYLGSSAGGGSHIVWDSFEFQGQALSAYTISVKGTNCALLNITLGPAAGNIPSNQYGITVDGTLGDSLLVYHSYIHDIGTPDDNQDSGANGSFPIEAGTNGVYWSNHITRGGHDTAIVHNGNHDVRFLNSVHDGGWGMAFEVFCDPGDAVYSQHNLFEGIVGPYTGRLEANIYKPGFELTCGYNTVRRSIFFGSSNKQTEISYFHGSPVPSMSGYNLVYNNTFYGGLKCYFQNDGHGGSGATAVFDGTMWVNNTCTEFTGEATEIYRDNTSVANAIGYNNIKAASGNTADPYLFSWFLDGPGTYGSSSACPSDHSGATCIPHGTVGQCNGMYDNGWRQSLAYMEACFTTVWVNNLSTDPLFVSVSDKDFHISPLSPLVGAGLHITDTIWPFPTANGTPVDIGAWGLR